jgi:hypothetical protein
MGPVSELTRVEILSRCLSDDALSSTYRIALNGGIVATQLKIRKKETVAYFKCHHGIGLEETWKTTKIFELVI